MSDKKETVRKLKFTFALSNTYYNGSSCGKQ